MEKVAAGIKKAQLSVYGAEMEAELRRILAFWEQHAPDEQNGGFVGQIDHAGQVKADAPRGAILNARILWTFSAAYRHTQKENHLQLARRAYHYLMEHFLDREYGGIYWSVNAGGAPLNTRKQIYALAFAIYGLSEYYQATAEEEALAACKELFRWIERYSFDEEFGGYFEAFSREGNLLEDLRLSPKDRNDPKTMNTHLHILEAYANLYRVWPDAQLAQQLKGLLEVFLRQIVDAESGHMHLFFNREWKVAANLVSYGHDIEASWLLLETAEVLGRQELIEEVKALAVQMARATGEGLQPDGSLYHELDREKQHYDTHREWWVSAEAMVGFLNAFELSKESSYMEKSWNSWQFAQKYLLDREKGEWIWGVWDDYSQMEEDKLGFWKCPYHNSRACLEVIHRCKRLAEESNTAKV
ncbi:AGE family epimerase/isomerase [Nafulsella turpanensis]|uniref:AGE family epimerase/isomerase n=1 Tax=Nafulsella turpanensis TaxID=1265690 RepID=UPI000349078E|nr:AGE family epimerase/isomerase [Nafulsella turpanensis]